ncbi:chemotaxis protein CheY [Maritalea myrionectae]|uniref:Chemotaxis protein CheY n=1 Tax=Maritalea myrionectae TaxID=454601 RepID=A0A2R4MIL5_9HYPH|nr:response regulator [Maritalea myrionectae]AVX05726.1 chemotaxis protein CheY [Maritalea myrionectae]
MQREGGNFADAMHALRRTYIQDLWEREEIVLDVLTKLEANDLNDDDLKDLEEVAHKFVGTGRTYQFPAISETGLIVEDLARDRVGANDPNLQPAILALLNACADARTEFEALDMAQQPATEEQPLSAETPKPAASANLPAVLIVDDDADTRSLLGQFMSDYAECTMAENSDQAEEFMAKMPFDLVLLDNKMPGGKTGLELLKHIKADATLRHMDVVMITASGEPQMVLDSLTAGASDYVLKPFKAEAVAQKLKTRLAHLKQTILLVDDDQAVQNLLQAKFRTLGVKCIGYDDGLQALQDMEDIKPDLVILDRILPGLEGMALLHNMRQNTSLKDIPVVILSAKRDNKDIMAGLQLGASDYVVKPFSLDELVLRCQRLLERAAVEGKPMGAHAYGA